MGGVRLRGGASHSEDIAGHNHATLRRTCHERRSDQGYDRVSGILKLGPARFGAPVEQGEQELQEKTEQLRLGNAANRLHVCGYTAVSGWFE